VHCEWPYVCEHHIAYSPNTACELLTPRLTILHNIVVTYIVTLHEGEDKDRLKILLRGGWQALLWDY
jgi:hypothetical protein